MRPEGTRSIVRGGALAPQRFELPSRSAGSVRLTRAAPAPSLNRSSWAKTSSAELESAVQVLATGRVGGRGARGLPLERRRFGQFLEAGHAVPEPEAILGQGGQLVEQGREAVDGAAVRAALGPCLVLGAYGSLGRGHARQQLVGADQVLGAELVRAADRSRSPTRKSRRGWRQGPTRRSA